MKAADRELAREALLLLLKGAKDSTMRSIYERIKPAPDGAIRCVVSPAGTETGRCSHSESFLEESTNLGNIPKKMAGLDPLYEVRDCIIAPPGRMLGEADESQAEARCAAWMAEEPLAMEQYNSGVDRYRYLSAAVEFDDPSRWKEVSKKSPMRQVVGKMGVLAFQYGVGWKTFMNQVNADADLTGFAIDAKIAKKTEGVHHELWPRYREWHAEVLEEVQRNGFLRNPFGRRRDFFARVTDDYSLAALQREAVAFLPQSTIADLLNSRLVAAYEAHDPDLLWIHLQIHDAIVFSCTPRDWMKASRAIKRIMEVEITIKGRPLLIPAEVVISSSSWSNARAAA